MRGVLPGIAGACGEDSLLVRQQQARVVACVLQQQEEAATQAAASALWRIGWNPLKQLPGVIATAARAAIQSTVLAIRNF